jgi:hypothetical protein
VVKLLEWFLESQAAHRTPFYYSGDLDVAGLEIASNLRQRFPGSYQTWKMDVDLYQRYSRKGIRLSVAESDRIVRQVPGWGESLPQAMAETGAKLHQELWVEELAVDFLSAFEME